MQKDSATHFNGQLHLLNTRLGGLARRETERSEEQKHLLPLPGFELWIIQPAAHPEICK